MLAVVEDQRFAIQLGHALQCAPQDRLLLLVHREVCGGLVTRRHLLRQLKRFRLPHGFLAIGATQSADLVTQNPAQPRTKFFRFTQSAELAPSVHERVLRQIFALAQVSGRRVRQRAEETLVSFHDPAEGLAIAGQAVGHQLGIGDEFN